MGSGACTGINSTSRSGFSHDARSGRDGMSRRPFPGADADFETTVRNVAILRWHKFPNVGGQRVLVPDIDTEDCTGR